MSTALAIPAVTAALTTVVQAAVDQLGLTPRPVVAAGPLDATGEDNRVGVHLYRVTRDAPLSTMDLPTRDATGALRARPRAAVDLHYLLTFRADQDWQAQAMLARATIVLHTRPSITPALLAETETNHPEVAGHGLADSEPVRFTPDVLTFDELVRLWTLYSPGLFAITLAVTAGPVLIDADAQPGTPLPVRRVAIGVLTPDVPRLDSVAGPDGAGAPVRAATPMPPLDLLGARLTDPVEVLLDGSAVPHTAVDSGHLVVSPPDLRPGRHTVQVRRVGPPADPALSATPSVAMSDVVAVQVVPVLGSAVANTVPGTAPDLRTGTVTATVSPVSPDQRVRLLLDAPTGALALTPAWPGAGTPPFTSVSFTVTDAPAGQYRATLEVDGTRSLPAVDSTGRYVLTVVTL